MGKKNKGLSNDKVVNQMLSQSNIEQNAALESNKNSDSNISKTKPVQSAKGGVAAAATKKNVKANAKPNIFKRMGKAFKEMWSELRKIKWLPFKQVMARLGVVLLVVLIFVVVITAFDFACNQLLDLLVVNKAA